MRWWITLCLLIGGIGVALLWNKYLPQPVTVSGTIHFGKKNHPYSQGTVYILSRQKGMHFQESGVITQAQEGAQWRWERALPGQQYDLKAQLRSDGYTTESAVIRVTAPQSGVKLLFKSF